MQMLFLRYHAGVLDAGFKVMNAVHRVVLGLTGGRFGWEAMGMPVVKLTTKGRRTGQERTSMLTSPYQEGDNLVLVASRGGDDRHPAWFLNLRDNPDVTVSVGGAPPKRMKAEVVSPEERARLWPLITKDHSNYAGYQKRTSREIPVVVLQPAGA